jgi:hypothetical protein
MHKRNNRTRPARKGSDGNAFFPMGSQPYMPDTSYTLRPSGENAFFGMRSAPIVLPATVFSASPNTPTVFNPAESALVKASSELGSIRTEKKSNWLSIFLAAAAGGLLTYYIVTKLAK